MSRTSNRKMRKLPKKVFVSQVKPKAKVHFARIACLCQIVTKPEGLMGYSRLVCWDRLGCGLSQIPFLLDEDDNMANM